jgi:hypothetical protein
MTTFIGKGSATDSQVTTSAGTVGSTFGNRPPAGPVFTATATSENVTQQLADVLKGLGDNGSDLVVNAYLSSCTFVAQALNIDWNVNSGATVGQTADLMRAAVVTRFQEAAPIIAAAASQGYVLPADPTPTFNAINATRALFAQLTISDDVSTQLSEAAIGLSQVVAAYQAGTITFNRSQPAAQLSSFEVSVDGMTSPSGDALADVLGYQPDANIVKQQAALSSLAGLDFSKRQPYLLFTADVITNGKRQNGTIVAWQVMHDASAYSVVRTDVFGQVTYPAITLANADVQASTAQLLTDNNFQQVLSYYDWITPSNVYAFVDSGTMPNTLYSYTVTGLQAIAPSSPFLFNVPMSALYLSAAQAAQVQALIAADLTEFADSGSINSVSPYPALAQAVYGDSSLGWILAGVNVQASQTRGDDYDATLLLTYMGAQATDIIQEAAAGRLFVPNDINSVHANVDAAISSYGVSQTLLAVLDATGMTLFISGKDDPLGSQPTVEALADATGGLAKVLSAIDPQTATLDPQVLAAALSVPTTDSAAKSYTFQEVSSGAPTAVHTFQFGVNAGSSPPVAVAPSLSSVLGTQTIDLTTYIGISSLMQLLRTVYDFYPGSLT